jgi:hypothetical protein
VGDGSSESSSEDAGLGEGSIASSEEADGSANERPCRPTDAVGGYDNNGIADSLYCGPMGLTTPVLILGWGWDGSQCKAILGCRCEGSDCPNLLSRRSACQAAYAHCSPDGG